MPKFKQYSANGIVSHGDNAIHFKRFCSPDSPVCPVCPDKTAESEVQETYSAKEVKCKLFTFEDEATEKIYQFYIDGVYIGEALL